jgi:hypothetical protein
VNIFRGASFGLSDRIANWISPGASCTVPQNVWQEWVGVGATAVAGYGIYDALGVPPEVDIEPDTDELPPVGGPAGSAPGGPAGGAPGGPAGSNGPPGYRGPVRPGLPR